MTVTPTPSLTSMFTHLSAETLTRVAEHLEHGGYLRTWETGVAQRAHRLAGNAEDAAALLYVAADEVRDRAAHDAAQDDPRYGRGH